MVEFDLSFTQDPQWISQREKEWEEAVLGLSPTLTKKELNNVKAYFFTGIKPKGFYIHPMEAICYFPVCTISSIEYCLQFYTDTKIEEEDLRSIYSLLTFELKNEAEAKNRIEVFKHFFGEHYNPERKLARELGPFYHPDKLVPRNADSLLSSIVRTLNWLEEEKQKEPVWIYLMDYVFSVLPAADVRLYDVDVEKKPRFWLGVEPCDRLYRMLVRFLKDVALGASPNSPHPSDSKKYKFCQDFYHRMENMDHYPGQLKQIWVNAKAAAQQQ